MATAANNTAARNHTARAGPTEKRLGLLTERMFASVQNARNHQPVAQWFE
jgi:hypothetical protein